jgi:hypothetical protein
MAKQVDIAFIGFGGISLDVWTTAMHARFDAWEHSVRITQDDDEITEIAGEENILQKRIARSSMP